MKKRILLAAFAVLPASALAQHEHHPAPQVDSVQTMPAHDMSSMMNGPLGISHERMGSGTSWMPDNSVMHANHKMWSGWNIMLHGVVFGQYDYQGSKRGDSQLGLVDWEMLMAMRHVGDGLLHFHAMASLEPLTLGARGYPLLLQTGESYKGEPLHDRQHPHDALMELAAMFQQPVARNLAVELYGGIAGEPALGPVAFMHRPSAQSDPLAPLGHHWQDATHISFGVVTAGLYSRSWKIEGSAFNGREPDENRWNLDMRKLDSYSGRVTVNPVPEWSLSGWYGYLANPEELHPDESVHRYGASALHDGRGLNGGRWSNALIVGVNAHSRHREASLLGETNLEIGSRNTVFGRVENLKKSAEDLAVTGFDPEREFGVTSVVAGYVREIQPIRGGTIGIGARGSVNFIPRALGAIYGTNAPKGIDVYVRIRPKPMAMGMSETMHEQGHEMRSPMGASMPMMSHDSSAAHVMHHDAPAHTDTEHMHHDSTAHATMHHDAMMHMNHDAMSHGKRTVAGKKAVAAKKSAVRKKSSTAAQKKRAPAAKKPAPKKDPHAGHDMKGMTMKPDTTRKK